MAKLNFDSKNKHFAKLVVAYCIKCFQMGNVSTKACHIELGRNGTMAVTMNVSVRMESLENTSVTTGTVLSAKSDSDVIFVYIFIRGS